ncbi:MAG: TIR domain-containing protein [Deltaproteobacteria bacterium]|nr:TIR domain-containing protein [Deltaproteobacteria bacterium]
MRVNVVRNAWKIGHPDSPQMRSFYDSSLWERRQLESPESLKRLIREGVEHTSAICVLVGSKTWSRRWVRYEIARAIIDGRGLLVVHLNSINHHQTRIPHALGINPLSLMAVGKVQATWLTPPQYYLFMRTVSGWERYQDHTASVSLPLWLPDPAPGYVTPLTSGSSEYNYIIQEGHKNIGVWIDSAARKAGR